MFKHLSFLFKTIKIMYIDDGQTVYIAERGNHRIMAWKHGAKSGQVVAGSCREGNGINQLYCPTDVIINNANDSLIISDSGNRRVVEWPRRNGTSGQVIISNIGCYSLAMDNNGCLYVSDTEKNEIRLFRIGDAHGTIVAGGNGRGNRLNQLNYPTHLFVDHEYSLFVSDLFNHRVMKWMKGAKEGIAVACDRDLRSGLTQLLGPRGVVVDPLGNVYVTDDNNHRVMLWYNRVTQSCIIAGGNGKGKQANQLDGSTGLSFDRQGNLYVVDYGNDRVQRFDILSHDRYLVIDNE
jgi:DNA-binding beta-propeller fold protein YncE